MSHILMIDDDKVLCDLLAGFLLTHGFTLSSVPHPSLGLKTFSEIKPKLVILDVMLPEQDGFSVLKEIRKRSETPVIMLTAKGDSIDRVLGLELGADDYIPKPFEPRELVARIKAVLKRSGKTPEEALVSGPIRIDRSARRVFIGTLELELTTMEYDLLVLFVSHPGRKFTRDELLSSLHETESESYGRAIDNLVNRVRRKIEVGVDSQCIRTIWGTGYMFIEPKVQE